MEAFEAVLADVDKSDVNSIVSLGDNVGYGPQPEAVMRRMEQRGIPSVMGNHELAIAEPAHMASFNPHARTSIIMTRAMLSQRAVDQIQKLPFFLTLGDKRFVHGFPPDSPTTYLFEVFGRPLALAMESLAEAICFVGHTHAPRIIRFNGDDLFSETPLPGVHRLDPNEKVIINPGSVGQPRDGGNRSKYAILDDTALTLDIRSVPYDIDAVARKILAAGLPENNARRLW